MPNWIEGTMKLRGKREDIRQFFKEGLEASDRNNVDDQVKDDSADDYLFFNFWADPHIKGTRRAFITSEYVEMYEDQGVACVDVKQAWTFSHGEDLNVWQEISEKYNVDIKLFGIEQGEEATEEVIIIRGHIPIINKRHYEDWDWDCPFPRMGG